MAIDRCKSRGIENMTWQQEVKRCAKNWRNKKKRAAAKAKPKPPEPPKVPRRVRGKQMDPARDIN